MQTTRACDAGECTGGDGQRERVAAHEQDVAHARLAHVARRARQHRVRDVETDDEPVGSHALREGEREVSLAARDVEHAVAALEAEVLHRVLHFAGERRHPEERREVRAQPVVEPGGQTEVERLLGDGRREARVEQIEHAVAHGEDAPAIGAAQPAFDHLGHLVGRAEGARQPQQRGRSLEQFLHGVLLVWRAQP